MRRQSMLFVDGWAHDGSAAAECFADQPDLRITFPHQLWLEGRGEPGCYARLLAQKIDGSACLIGWSMGAMIALETATQNTSNLEKLVLISATPRFCSTKDFPHGVPPQILVSMQRECQGNTKLLVSSFFRKFRNNFNEMADKASEMGRESLIDGLTYLENFDLRDKIADVPVPVLLIHGRKDNIVPWQASEHMQRHLPNAQFLLLDEVGHDVLGESALTVRRAITEFVGRQVFAENGYAKK